MRKVAVTGDPAEGQVEVNRALTPHGGEADVVGVFQRADAAAAVEGDVEFPGEPVQLAVIKDVVVHLPGEIARVDQFLWVDAGGGRAGDVADVVGAGAAVDDSQFVQAHEDVDGVPRADLAHLEVGASGTPSTS